MDPRLQAKLLRAIQEREIDRVGGSQPVKVDIRILATSNRDLDEAVSDGQFREDLLYRLNVVNLRLPPLRERPGDVLALADIFVKKYAAANGVADRALSSEAARAALARHHWPGNVRELENAMHRAVLLSTGGRDRAPTPSAAGRPLRRSGAAQSGFAMRLAPAPSRRGRGHGDAAGRRRRRRDRHAGRPDRGRRRAAT